jgi:hypothetical protein
MFVDSIFRTTEVKTIITNNDPDKKQNAPWYSIGFRDGNENGGQLIIERK